MKKKSRYEIRLSGSGGQGIITAAVILAEAAGVYQGKYVCQTQSYGPEARGGKSKSEVIISDTPIDYPKVLEMDLLLAMNQAACDSYCYDFKQNGLLVVDSTFVKNLPTSRVLPIPFTERARTEFKKEWVANVIAIGAIGHFCPVLELDYLKKALTKRVPIDTITLNLEAFQCGVEAAEQFQLSSLPRAFTPDEEVEI